MRSLDAVKVHAHQPMGIDKKTTTANARAGKKASNAINSTQPNTVPTVPGALGLKPDPSPKPKAYAGCLHTMRQLGGCALGSVTMMGLVSGE